MRHPPKQTHGPLYAPRRSWYALRSSSAAAWYFCFLASPMAFHSSPITPISSRIGLSGRSSRSVLVRSTTKIWSVVRVRVRVRV